MPIKTYRPRAALVLTVPLPKGGGSFEPYTYTVPVSRAQLTSNDHNHADTLTVTVDWLDAGTDPRWIAGATAEFYLGNAGAAGEWSPSERDLRFVGRMVKPSRRCEADKLSVELEFHDYTSFFLLAKPFATAGVPRFTDDLRQAWARICEHTPGAEELGDNIEFLGVEEVPVLGQAVVPRFRKAGKLQHSPQTDAWAIWQQAVGAAGLISYIELDQCVVTTALDYYTAAAPPRFVWGRNLLTFEEHRNGDFALKPVGITSFDPITGRTIEVIHDPLQRTIKVGARKRKGGKAPKVKTDLSQVEFFQFSGVTDEDALRRIAERVYEERSRQAMEGSLTTADMDAATADDQEMDLLELGAGDLIDVRFMDSDDAAFVREFPSVERRVAYLVGRGYTESVARVIANNVDFMTNLSSQFYVKSVETEIDLSGDGSFKLTVNYINKIDPRTGAVA